MNGIHTTNGAPRSRQEHFVRPVGFSFLLLLTPLSFPATMQVFPKTFSRPAGSVGSTSLSLSIQALQNQELHLHR